MDTREMPELFKAGLYIIQILAESIRTTPNSIQGLFKVGLYRICDGPTIGMQLLLTGGSAIANSLA